MGNKYRYQTFENWCLEYDRQYLLDLWDYEKNSVLPSDIPAGTKQRYYFKCVNGIHDSEEKRILTITDKPNYQIVCSQCNRGPIGNTREDLTGRKYGELTVIKFDEERTQQTKNTYWICDCSCGNTVSVSATKLKSGNKLTCGGKTRHKTIKVNNDYDDKITDMFDPSYLQEIRTCSDYYHFRQEVIQREGGKCIVCGSTENIEVHHIYPFSTHPNLRLDPNNGICICKQHHSVSSDISFHSIYGRYDNTPEQLEEYVNYMRYLIGNDEHFDVYKYMNNINSDNLEIDDFNILD